MSASLQSRAEILKLARLLRRDPTTLAYLSDVSPEDLVRLREQVTDVLFNAHGQVLARLATASKLLPVGIVATIGERAFGPMLAARVTGLLDPARAVEMAARLPIEFLADVAIELDPRRASRVISGIPSAQIADITRVLMARGEHVTMGRFVSYLDAGAISAAVAVMDDPSLLQVSFVLESRDGLQELIGLLPPERLGGIIDAAMAEDLWVEVLDLITHLTDEQASRLIDAAAARDDAVLDSLIASAQEHDMWASVLPVTVVMSEASRRRFAGLASIQSDGVLERIVTVAREQDLWPQLLPIAGLLPEPAMARLGTSVAGLGLSEAEVDRLLSTATQEHLRVPVARLADAAGLVARPPASGPASLDPA